MKNKVLAFILSAVMLFSALSVTAGAIVQQKPVYTEAGTAEGKEDAFPAIQDAFADYIVGETTTMEDDGYIGIPVDITVYNDAEKMPGHTPVSELSYLYETAEPNSVNESANGKPVVLYVINTNTERVGTDSDVSIIKNLLDEGYIIMIVDYKNELRAKSPDLDWSLQKIRTKITDYTAGLTVWSSYDYIVPAGYMLRRGVQYFNYIESGVDGILEFVVDIWNIDLKRTSGDYNRGNRWSVIWGQKELIDGTLVYQDADGNRCIPYGDTYAYYTQNADYSYTVGDTVAEDAVITPLYKKVTDDAVFTDETTRKLKIRYAIAEDWWDCVKPNGDRLDFNLYMDITYPTNPKNDVPAMMLASSSETRSSATRTATRPISTGFMFTGYAFVNYDHAYTPMARNDHFGYFEGESSIGRRNGFTLNAHTGVEAQTAAVRCVRALSDMYEQIPIDVYRIGAWGHSKAACVNLLGTAHPELQKNDRFISGHAGECSGIQPWLTYQDGTPIPSNIQLVYTSNGGGAYLTFPDSAPTVVTQGEVDGDFTATSHYALVLHALRSNNTPALDMSMEGVGHTTIYGYNEERGYDMYQALFDFANYYLKDEASVCEYILPKSGMVNVPVTDDIILKFTGPISESEITEKVTVKNAVTGELAEGIWQSAFGGNEWTFTPMGLQGGTVYTVTVPEHLIAENGKAIKARKSASFRTAYETAFEAVSVESTNGSMTLTKTEEGANGIYFVFGPIEVTHNTGTTLRFSVMNNASTLLRVYGVSALSETVTESTLTEAAIGDVGIAGVGIVELDVTEYIASLPDGASPAFYIEALKTEGTVTIYENDLNDSASLSPFTSSQVTETPNGTVGFQTALGKEAAWSTLIGTTLTENDYGRLITLTFDAYATIDRSLHVQFTLLKNTKQEDGEFFVDYYNDAYKNVMLTGGEWQTVTVTYFIDNHDYVKDSIQKRKILVDVSGDKISTETLYLDNFKITETVVNAEIAAEHTGMSIAPMLAVKTANRETVGVNQAGYVQNGAYGDTGFDGAGGYLVSGKTDGIPDDTFAAAYVKADLSSLLDGKPYALSISVSEGEGVLEVWGIQDPAVCEAIDVSTLNYLNAPAIDRARTAIDPDAVYGGKALGTIKVFGSGDYQLTITDYLFAMKELGASYGALIITAAEGTRDSIRFDFTDSAKTTVTTPLNRFDFDEDESYTTVVNRDYAVYDLTDIFMQGSQSAQDAMENDGITPSAEIFYGDSGQSIEIKAPTGGYNVYKFLRLINTEDTVFSAADVGKTCTVTFKLYLTATNSKTITIGMSTVAAGANDGTNSTKVHQPMALSELAVGAWNDITYTFTVTEAMVGARASQPNVDTRPINFCIFGVGNNTMYIDEMQFARTAAYDADSFPDTYRISHNLEDSSGMTANGFEPIANQDGTTTSRVSYSELDNTTYGGKISYRVLANKSYNRIYAQNLFTLTEQNIGDTFTVTFKMKASKASYLYAVVGNYTYTDDTAYDGMPTVETIRITADEVGKWVTRSYSFTVTEALVATGYTGLRFKLQGFGNANTELFFDDFLCYREISDGGIRLPVEESMPTYEYTYLDFETAPSVTPNGFEKITLEDGSEILRYGVSTEENTTEGGSYSYKLQHNKYYNRLFFNNFFSADLITADHIGDTYTIFFKAMVSRAGSFYLSAALPASGYDSYTGMPTRGTFTFTEDQVGTWVDCTYQITVTEGMVNAPSKITDGTVTATAPATSLRITFQNGFATQETTVYFDDIYCYRNLPEGARLEAEDASATVTTDTLMEDVLTAKLSYEKSGIHKAYFSFDISDYAFAHKAILALTANSHQGQRFKLYALTGVTLPDSLTYNNAPANTRDESMLAEYLYGGKEVASFFFDENGRASIDITDYVKAHLGKTVCFAVTAEDGSMTYLDLDFVKANVTVGTDVTSDGELALTDGKLSVGGTRVTLSNAFASGETTLPALEPVTIEVGISADTEKSYVFSVDGTPYTVTATPTDGKVTLTFTPSSDVTVSTVSITAESAGFTVSYVKIISECVASLTAPAMELYTPTEPEYTFDGVLLGHNVALSESIVYKAYVNSDKNVTSILVDGAPIDLSVLSLGTANGANAYIVPIELYAAEAMSDHSITVVLSGGETAIYRIGLSSYLESILSDTEENSPLAALAEELTSYLVSSTEFFLGEDIKEAIEANARAAYILTKNYKAETPASILTAEAVREVTDSGLASASLMLGEKPVFVFRTTEQTQNSDFAFTVGGASVDYKRVMIGDKIYLFVYTLPAQLCDTVCWEADGMSGSYNLKAYYNSASSNEMLTALVEAMWRYSEACKAYGG